VRGFFVGWRANLLRDVPFSVMKMALYESCTHVYQSVRGRGGEGIEGLTPLESGTVSIRIKVRVKVWG
jgi:hypothetical protein